MNIKLKKKNGINIKKKINEKRKLLIEKFRNDLLEDLEIKDHPKANMLYYIAWELGHSNGFCSVYDYAEQLLPLIQD